MTAEQLELIRYNPLLTAIYFAEWLGEYYNYIGGEYDGDWCRKWYSIKDVDRYQSTTELFPLFVEQRYKYDAQTNQKTTI